MAFKTTYSTVSLHLSESIVSSGSRTICKKTWSRFCHGFSVAYGLINSWFDDLIEVWLGMCSVLSPHGIPRSGARAWVICNGPRSACCWAEFKGAEAVWVDLSIQPFKRAPNYAHCTYYVCWSRFPQHLGRWHYRSYTACAVAQMSNKLVKTYASFWLHALPGIPHSQPTPFQSVQIDYTWLYCSCGCNIKPCPCQGCQMFLVVEGMRRL